MKQSVRYGILALSLVVAMLWQPVWPALWLTVRADEVSKVPPPPPLPAQVAPACNTVYLPLILNQSLTARTDGLAIGAAQATGSEFIIISPRQDWQISGMLFFAAQPLVVSQITSMTFKAGPTDLGTDSTPADGFKAFLNADDFPAGPLQLTATAYGGCEAVSKTITVTVVDNPPLSGAIGSAGGVLASENASLITIPPGGAANGTNVSVTQLSQAQVESTTGLDWATLGLTFLGAQNVQASAPFSLPLTIASVGFGNQVQPDQTIVNYRTVPDSNSDGLDELAVFNLGHLAPNDDLISEPVLQLQIGSTGSLVGRPGKIITLPVNGFNHHAAFGNVAIYRSEVNGTTIEVPLVVQLAAEGPADQTASAIIPYLPAGAAKLTLRNKSTGSSLGPFNVTIQAPQSLNGSAADIIDETLALSLAALADSQTLAANNNLSQLVSDIDKTADKLSEVRTYLHQISLNPTPEQAELLTRLAVMLENSNASTLLTQEKTSGPNQLQAADQMLCDMLAVLTVVAQVAVIIYDLTDNLPAGLVTGLLFTILIRGTEYCFGATPQPQPAGFVGGIVGMASSAPVGGNGSGNIPAPPFNLKANLLSQPSADLFDQQPGRFVVKLVSEGSPSPFTGLTDAGGYFFLPLIAAGEPFTATAIDTLTSQTRTVQGVGPALGQSVLLFFDFFTNAATSGSIAWDGGGDGSSWRDPLNWNLDRLPTLTDTVVIDMPGTITVTHSFGTSAIASLSSREAIVISGGSLSMNAASEINNSLTVSGGTLGSAAVLTVTGLLSWTDGTLAGPGSLNANGGIFINGTANKFLNGLTLNNTGSALWRGSGSINAYNGAVFNNQAGRLFLAQNDSSFTTCCVGATTALFNNQGTFRKSVASGITTFGAGVTFSGGNIEVQSGTLSLGGSGTTTTDSTFTISSGATLDLTGGSTHTYVGNFTGSGGGMVRLNGGTLQIGAAGVTFNFPGAMLQWSGGTLTGPGILTNADTLNISGAASKSLNGLTLNNAGTTIWTGSGSINGSNNAVFNNQAGRLFQAQGDASLIACCAGTLTATFNNQGTFRKSAGTGTTALGVGIMFNGGNVEVQSGTLNLNSTGTTLPGGTFTVASGATLDLTGSGSPSIYEGSFSGSGGGTVRLNADVTQIGPAGATFNFPGAMLQWSDGTLTGPGALTNAGTLNISGTADKYLNGATLNNNGTVIWSGNGTINAYNGAIVNNQAGRLFHAQNDADFTTCCVISTTATFNNQGTFRKSVGTGTTTFGAGVTFSGGNVNVQSGLLNLSGADTTTTGGNFTVSSGATLNLTGGSSPRIYEGNFTGSGAGTVRLNAGTLQIGPAGATFNFPGAMLRWSGGTLSGPGIMTNTGTLNIAGAADKFMDGLTLTNAGTVLWIDGGAINAYNGALFNNQSGRLFETQSNASFTTCCVTSTTAIVNNQGTFRKSAGAGTTIFGAGVTFSGGNVEVLTGTIILSGTGTTTSGGNFAISNGAVLDLNGGSSHTYVGNFTGSGAGTVRLNASTIQIGAGGATFNFPGTLFQWSGGTLTGPGTLTNAGALNISGTATKFLNGLTLNNTGVVTWTGSGAINGYNTAQFNNMASGIFEVRNNASFTTCCVGGTTASFNNQGTFRKTAGTGTTTFGASISFNNSNTLLAQTGVLNFSGGYTQSGGVLNLNGGNLSGSSLNLQGGSLNGSGNITTTLTNAATINPGGTGQAGRLIINGDYNQAATGNLNIELGGLSAAQYDRLTPSGAASLNGGLTITTINSFTPNPGDLFQPMTYGSLTGTFLTVTGPYTPTYNPTNLTIERQ